MALRGRREPPSQSDGLGGPSYRFPQIVTALSIAVFSPEISALTTGKAGSGTLIPRLLDTPQRHATTQAPQLPPLTIT